MFARLVIALFMALSAATPAGAYKFTPIHAQLTPSGPGASTSFTASNPHSVPVAIELEVVERRLDATGAEHRQPEPDDFLVVPPQLVLMPKQSQTVRVQWLGPPQLEREQAYRLLAKQVPVSLEEESEGAQIDVNYNYEITLYVTPPGGRPDVQVEAVEAITGAEGRQLRLTLRNHGRQRGILERPVLELKRPGGEPVLIEGPEAAPLAGQNIFPGALRHVSLPWPAGLQAVPTAAVLRTGYVGLSE